MPRHPASPWTPDAILARLLYKDEAMLVLDKPPGIAVHKGPGGGITLDAFFPALQLDAPGPPELAHRLDKDTSGCLVLGRTRPALARLGRLFKDGRVTKIYWAVVVGHLAQDSGVINAPLARRSHDRRSWWMKLDESGDTAQTHWRVLGRADGLVWLELLPKTGRTHQLRVHTAHLGCPIAGDAIYGGDRALAAARHLHLHARSIMVPFVTDTPVSVEADPPMHMRILLEACGWQP